MGGGNVRLEHKVPPLRSPFPSGMRSSGRDDSSRRVTPNLHLLLEQLLFVVVKQRHHVVAFQLLPAVQEVEFDHEAQPDDLRS